jgi:hypothetical protein
MSANIDKKDIALGFIVLLLTIVVVVFYIAF